MSPLSERRQREWLSRSFSWKLHEEDRDIWRPIRVLGQGGFGICGLWETTGQDGDKDYVVVKQVGWRASDRGSLQNESNLLTLCQNAKDTEHVLKILKLYHTARGTGVDSNIDPNDRGKAIGRMYVEFCNSGDMWHYIRRLQVAGETGFQTTEERIWRIWQCLVKSLAVLEQGSEDERCDNWRPIVHFDIKPMNIVFLSNIRKDPNTHIFTPVFKEQIHWRADRKQIGPPANIFGIALCIYQLLVPGYRVMTNESIEVRLSGPDIPGFKAYGSHLMGETRPPYSKTLIGLLLNCLAHDPGIRPTASQLLDVIEMALEHFDELRTVEGANMNPMANNLYENSVYDDFDFEESATVHEEDVWGGETPPRATGPPRRNRDNVTASGRSWEPILSVQGPITGSDTEEEESESSLSTLNVDDEIPTPTLSPRQWVTI
ncbi:hypothetical protein PVAG01_03122 [Phlyctema vagabunda]|uniref:Protein kinase domain-containing protein n=1 Tax=Phlyctema vagabunda TaxID=108571 RepID=A0ABR4PSL2_9HELO